MASSICYLCSTDGKTTTLIVPQYATLTFYIANREIDERCAMCFRHYATMRKGMVFVVKLLGEIPTKCKVK